MATKYRMEFGIGHKIVGALMLALLALGAAYKLGVFNFGASSEDAEVATVTVTDPTTGEPMEIAAPGAPALPPPALSGENRPDVIFSAVEWPGYAPLLYANGGLTTQPGSIFDELGISVRILLQNQIPTLNENFSGANPVADCNWRTVDFWAQEIGSLPSPDFASMYAIVDNTRGGDAIFVGPNSPIRRVEDFDGKRIALTPGTPSHWLLEYAIRNSSLNRAAQERVRNNLILVESPTEARILLEQGNADAAVLWEPDTTLARYNLNGGRIVYSTEIATSLVYDGIVCRRDFADSRISVRGELRSPVEVFIEGWMKGVEAAERDPDGAVSVLVRNEPLMAEVAAELGTGAVREMFQSIVWSGLEENQRYLDTGMFARVYNESSEVWVDTGFSAGNPPSCQRTSCPAFDDTYLRNVINRLSPTERQLVQEAAQQPLVEFTAAGREQVVDERPEPIQTRPVSIFFEPGMADITPSARRVLDREVYPMLQAFETSYFLVAGNTDSTGDASLNQRLSQRRANAVVDYLSENYDISPSRFEVVGNGENPDTMACPESNLPSGMTLEECREQNRRTDFGVLH